MIQRSILTRKSSGIPHRKRYAVVCFCMLSGLLCSLTYAHLGAEFGGISHNQFYGLIFSTAASILLLIVGLLSCLYFARSDTTFTFPLKMLILMTVQFGLSFTGLVYFLFLPLPNKLEMKQFVITNETGKYNSAMLRLQQELHCCGVESYEDYRYPMNGIANWEVPLSCCDHQDESASKSNCDNPQNIATAPPDYKMGCLVGIGEIGDLKLLAPTFYLLMNLTRFLVLGLSLVSLILIATLLSYFYTFYTRRNAYGDNSSLKSQEENMSETVSSTSTVISPSVASIEVTSVKTIETNDQSTIPEFEIETVTNKSSDRPRSGRGGTKKAYMTAPVSYNMLTLDFAKISELSLAQLPGSLSQLSNFIYGTQATFQLPHTLQTNKFV